MTAVSGGPAQAGTSPVTGVVYGTEETVVTRNRFVGHQSFTGVGIRARALASQELAGGRPDTAGGRAAWLADAGVAGVQQGATVAIGVAACSIDYRHP